MSFAQGLQAGMDFATEIRDGIKGVPTARQLAAQQQAIEKTLRERQLAQQMRQLELNEKLGKASMEDMAARSAQAADARHAAHLERTAAGNERLMRLGMAMQEMGARLGGPPASAPRPFQPTRRIVRTNNETGEVTTDTYALTPNQAEPGVVAPGKPPASPYQADIDKIGSAILEHRKQMALGDSRYGLINLFGRQGAVDELEKQKAALTALGDGTRASPAPAVQQPGIFDNPGTRIALALNPATMLPALGSEVVRAMRSDGQPPAEPRPVPMVKMVRGGVAAMIPETQARKAEDSGWRRAQ